MKTATVLLVLLAALPALTLAFAPAPLPKPAKTGRVEVGKNVTLEVLGRKPQKRRVIVAATVCLREGTLEHLVTRKARKEHEAILAADVDARDVHKALLLAGAVPGSPVRMHPRYVAPRGHVIQLTLQWQGENGPQRADAREWVRDVKSKKAMTHDWVFAGSHLVTVPQDKRQHYLANDGDVICLSNFEGALLDLPIESTADSSKLLHEAFTEKIPPVGTQVNLILEPVGGGKQ